ncbi:MAG: DEAD/DEAH box helicase [Candidatus Pacebacteria bacterium]|nr:DEAD/DEAH box helicase [Candidatus Paceibacterota bacterium]
METTTQRRGRPAPRGDGRRTFSSAPSHSRGAPQGNRRPQQGPRSGGGFQSRGGNRPPQGRGARKMQTFNPSQFINTHPVDTVEEVYTPTHTFATLGLSSSLVHTITAMGIDTPTPIQDQIIPHVLQGRDVIGLAETGTGKTAAFLVPLIEKTIADPRRETLILTPTRELAIQIEGEFRKLGRGQKLYATVCVGGTGISPQIRALRQHNHFIIGTPGRILDLIRTKNFQTQYVTTVVLDEADRMLDMGFINDMRAILSSIRTDRETLFFSATMSRETEVLVKDFLRDPVVVSVKKKDVTNSIEQDVVPYEQHTKFETLLELLANPDMKRVLIFGSMKHSVERLAQQLTEQGVRADSIHGNKNHGQRQRALANFKEGRARVLVATDVAARGIHVDSVSHVINYDLPNCFDDYVHRIGRTGRAHKHGKALTFVPAGAVGGRRY